MAAALPAEDRQRGARAVERAHEIDVHHPPHDVGIHLLDRAVVAEPGIADHDVEPAERLLRARHEPLDVLLARDVHRHRFSAAAGRSDARHGLFESIEPPRAEHDRDALARQMFGDGQADA